MRESLEQATAFEGRTGFAVYRGAEISGVDPDQLAYFGASVFWRASCHGWNYEDRTTLGAYEEPFRRFLLREAPWPEKAWLTVGCVPKHHNGGCQTFSLPKFDTKANGYWSHRLRFLGIMFLLSVGNFVPEHLRQYCIQHASHRPVVLGEAITAMVINDIKPFRNILYKGKAGKLMEPILNKKH